MTVRLTLLEPCSRTLPTNPSSEKGNIQLHTRPQREQNSRCTYAIANLQAPKPLNMNAQTNSEELLYTEIFGQCLVTDVNFLCVPYPTMTKGDSNDPAHASKDAAHSKILYPQNSLPRCCTVLLSEPRLVVQHAHASLLQRFRRPSIRCYFCT